jgi:VWFA-related protein
MREVVHRSRGCTQRLCLKRIGFGVFFMAMLAACGGVLAQQTLRVDVNLVNIFATVQDANDQFVAGLSRADFRVYEDDALQEIQVFEGEDKIHSSLGMVVDTSGSMIDVLPYMRRGIREFTRSLPGTDEFFVLSFGTSTRLIHRSTQGQRHLDESLDRLRAYGTSLLFDALLYGNDKVDPLEGPRKALVVFTDGIFTDDKNPAAPYARVVEETQRSSILLYFIVIGPRILVDMNTVESLSKISGGRTFYVSKNDSVAAALDNIRSELSKQYYLGYYAPRKSGLHHIRVEIPGRDVKVRAKTAYIGG